MSNKKLTRRGLIQNASFLILGSAISPAVLGQNTNTREGEPKTVFIPPGGGQKGIISGSEINFKLDAIQTAGNFGGLEITIPVAKLGAPPHYHKNFDEICIVLEGTVHIMVEDEVFEVKKGGWHLRPRGKVHTFWNSGKKKAKVIELCAPGGHEAYMKELAALFENGGSPKPNDLQKLARAPPWRFDLLTTTIKQLFSTST